MTTNSDQPRLSQPVLTVVRNDDPIDLEALEVLKAFLLSPQSDETGRRIDEFAERRQSRAQLRSVK